MNQPEHIIHGSHQGEPRTMFLWEPVVVFPGALRSDDDYISISVDNPNSVTTPDSINGYMNIARSDIPAIISWLAAHITPNPSRG